MTRRGVSTAVGYVLILGISSLLVTGLLVASGSYLTDQRRTTVTNELEVLGHQLAADIAATDRAVRAGGTTVVVSRRLPKQVTDLPYRIRVDPGSPTTLTLTTEDPEVTVEVTVRTRTPVGPAGGTTLYGGTVTVEYTGSRLAVRNGD